MKESRKKHHRKKWQIAEDVAFIIRAGGALTFNAKQAVIKNAIWCWTQYYGKFNGCPFWSVEARNSDRNTKNLRHEHVVPIRVLRNRLLAMDSPSTNDVFEFLKNNAIGCVVTNKEHDRLDKEFKQEMPSEFNETGDPWVRYKRVGIEYVEIPPATGSDADGYFVPSK